MRDGIISSISEPSALQERSADIDAQGCLVIPGMINAHFHSAENFNPGLYENLPLDFWFVHSHQVSRQSPPDAETIYSRTMLGAIQMLRNGITTVVDFLFEAPEISLDTLEPVIAAYRDSGIRATVLLGVADKRFADSLPLTDAERASWGSEAEPPPLERIMDVTNRAFERWHEPHGMIGIGMGPSAPQRCSDELMAASLDFCSKRGLAWQTHVLETKTQAMTARDWHDGSSFIEVLSERGQLDPNTTLAHAVWLSDEDVRLISAAGSSVVHCPISNLRLGDGVAPVPAFLRHGVNVALGTDGRGCDESLDVLELAKYVALLNKGRGADHSDWVSATQAFDMATRNGSRVTGHGETLGRLEQGACADLVVIPLTEIEFAPLHDPIRQLVFGCNGRSVRDVVVAGEVVVRDGTLTRVNQDQAVAQALRASESEREPADGSVAQKLEGLLHGLAERTRQADLPLNSYIPPGP
jgi:5-methylthioadenosine/S-adenosylhomocysteine deaminase